MREVIAKILEAEAEGKRIVAAAKSEADRIMSDARDQAREETSRLHKDTQIEIDRMVEESSKAIEQERKSALARAIIDIAVQFPIDMPALSEAVLTGVQCVVRSHTDEPDN
jgi:vacuolar-type H+-ATPase subunit H